MPAYSTRGLRAGPYWDAFDPDATSPFDPNHENARGLLETLPAWAVPTMPPWAGGYLQPWPGQTGQALDDRASILSPTPTPPWWLGLLAPAPQPLLPPWAYPPPDFPWLPPAAPDYTPRPYPLPRVDDPVDITLFGSAFPNDKLSPRTQPFAQSGDPLGAEPLPEQGVTGGLLGIPPFQTSPYARDFAASFMPIAFPPLGTLDTGLALAPLDRFEPYAWAPPGSPSPGLLDPYGLTYGPNSVATQAAHHDEALGEAGAEAEAGSETDFSGDEPDDETTAHDQDQGYPSLAQAPKNQPPPRRRPAPPPPAMSAVRTGPIEVMIASEDGTVEVRTGGSRAWRNHNPGNLIDGDFSKRHGAIGTDGDIAIFPNEEIGRRAAIANLRTPKYQALTLDKAIETWASRPTDPVAKYQEFVRDKMGLPGNTPLSSLTQPEIERLYETIKRFERSTPGTITRYAR